MKRSRITRGFVIAAMLALCAIPLIWWMTLKRKPASGQGEVQQMAQQLLSDPAKFANTHFKGGIGAMLSVHTSGLLMVNGVISGSPAEKAGLKGGDVILEIDGRSTKGQPLSQTVEWIRGFAMASVHILVQRDGTNLNCVVSRTSWKILEELGMIRVSSPRTTVPPQGGPGSGPDPLGMFDPFTLFPATPSLVQTNF